MDKHDDNLIWEAYTIGSEDEYPKRMAPRANKETTIDVPRGYAKEFHDKFGKYIDGYDHHTVPGTVIFQVSIPRPSKKLHLAMRDFAKGDRPDPFA